MSTIEIIFTIISIILGVTWFFVGARKLIGWEEGKQSYLRYHKVWGYYASGVVELLGGIGTIIPITRFISSVAILGMIIFVASHKWEKVELKWIVPQIILTTLTILVIWHTWP